MKICICGWYFRESFLYKLFPLRNDIFVIKHREGNTQGLPSKLYENRGLEFGAYRQYLENHWDGQSDVLFCHDDTELASRSALEDIASLNDMGVDQAYIFHDEADEYINGGAHGRGIWIRGTILRDLAADFPADMDNTGTNIGLTAQKGILKFHERILTLSKNTGVIAIVPQFHFAHRGRLHETMFVYRKVHGPVLGGPVHVA